MKIHISQILANFEGPDFNPAEALRSCGIVWRRTESGSWEFIFARKMDDDGSIFTYSDFAYACLAGTNARDVCNIEGVIFDQVYAWLGIDRARFEKFSLPAQVFPLFTAYGHSIFRNAVACEIDRAEIGTDETSA